MQDLVPPRPADTASTSPGDLIAGYEAHLTPLIHARFGAGEPEQVGRLRADALDALVCGRTLAERLMPMRRVTAGSPGRRARPGNRRGGRQEGGAHGPTANTSTLTRPLPPTTRATCSRTTRRPAADGSRGAARPRPGPRGAGRAAGRQDALTAVVQTLLAHSVTTTAELAGLTSADLNPTRTKTGAVPGGGTPGAAGESDPLVTVDPPHAPKPCTSPSPHLATEPADTDDQKRRPTTMRERWARIWPSPLAVVTLSAVGGPAAVASYTPLAR